MSITRCDEALETQIFARNRSLTLNKGSLRLTVSCPKGDCEWKYILIGYAYKIETDREDYLIEPSRIEDNGQDIELSCEINLRSFPFRPTNWYIRAVYEAEGKLYAAKVITKQRKPRLSTFLRESNSFSYDGNIVFSCVMRGGYLGLRFRERTKYDGYATKLREMIAVRKYNRHKKEYQDRKIYLIFEKRCAKAQDNGYYLFKYCMDNNMEEYLDRSIYYVITKDSPDRRKLEPYKDHVIIFGSIKHMIYLMACRLLISSDSRAHAYIWQYDRSLVGSRIAGKKHVFLGHGVLALKKLNDSFLASRMNSVMTTVTSDAEADIVTEHLGFRKHDAVVTGYARFDALKDASDSCREILIMPTHRSWLFGVDRETFVGSEYYRRYMSLLNSPELIRLLKDNDLTANFYLHPSIIEHLDAFSVSDEHVRIIKFGEVPLDDLMMRCKLLVTDYSSVCWDLYYMGKPAIFYQYDVEDYLATWGSYIDLEKDTPGNRASEEEELIAYIRESIELGFRLDDKWSSRREEHFRYIDTSNSARICDALKERNL